MNSTELHVILGVFFSRFIAAPVCHVIILMVGQLLLLAIVFLPSKRTELLKSVSVEEETSTVLSHSSS